MKTKPPKTRITSRAQLIQRVRHELTVRGCGPDPGDVREAFEAAHEERYGFRDPSAEIEVALAPPSH